jgi:hypothetical protein
MGFVEDWWGLRDYDRRRRIIANAPKPTAQSERADGSGTAEILSMKIVFEEVPAWSKSPPLR